MTSMNTRRARRIRMGIEALLTGISVITLVLTIVAHDWIEQTLGASPDRGTGETEWLLSAAALVATLLFASITVLEWRHVRAGSARA